MPSNRLSLGMRPDYELAVDSDPRHIPGIVSWLLRATAGALSDTTQLHLRARFKSCCIAPCNAEDAGGWGIFPALSFFPNLRYNDRGNEVTVRVPIA